MSADLDPSRNAGAHFNMHINYFFTQKSDSGPKSRRGKYPLLCTTLVVLRPNHCGQCTACTTMQGAQCRNCSVHKERRCDVIITYTCTYSSTRVPVRVHWCTRVYTRTYVYTCINTSCSRGASTWKQTRFFRTNKPVELPTESSVSCAPASSVRHRSHAQHPQRLHAHKVASAATAQRACR